MNEFELFTDNLEIYNTVVDKLRSYGFNAKVNIDPVHGEYRIVTDATPAILDKVCAGLTDFAEVIAIDEPTYDPSDVYTLVW
jgi:hypothetical protein